MKVRVEGRQGAILWWVMGGIVITLCGLLCVYIFVRWRSTQNREKKPPRPKESGERNGGRKGANGVEEGSQRKGLSEKETLIQDRSQKWESVMLVKLWKKWTNFIQNFRFVWLRRKWEMVRERVDEGEEEEEGSKQCWWHSVSALFFFTLRTVKEEEMGGKGGSLCPIVLLTVWVKEREPLGPS